MSSRSLGLISLINHKSQTRSRSSWGRWQPSKRVKQQNSMSMETCSLRFCDGFEMIQPLTELRVAEGVVPGRLPVILVPHRGPSSLNDKRIDTRRDGERCLA